MRCTSSRLGEHRRSRQWGAQSKGLGKKGDDLPSRTTVCCQRGAYTPSQCYSRLKWRWCKASTGSIGRQQGDRPGQRHGYLQHVGESSARDCSEVKYTRTYAATGRSTQTMQNLTMSVALANSNGTLTKENLSKNQKRISPHDTE